MTHGATNVAASIRQRLANEAKRTGRPFQEVLTHFALERFLFRLSRSPHAGRFVLKGGLLLRALEGPQTRPTRDIDLLGHGDSSAEGMVSVIREVCVTPVELDGMRFDPATVRGEQTRSNEEYRGVRTRLVGFLERARAPIMVDVGFGDVVIPAPVQLDFPVILDLPAPRLRAYTRESMIAEKFQAMVSLGEVNGRFKDFYDIWFLSRRFAFDGRDLASAIRATFERRETDVPAEPLALTEQFAREPAREIEWRALLRRAGLDDAPGTFTEVVADLRVFLRPIIERVVAGHVDGFGGWHAAGEWV